MDKQKKMIIVDEEMFKQLWKVRDTGIYISLPVKFDDLEDAPPKGLKCSICGRWGCRSDHGYG